MKRFLVHAAITICILATGYWIHGAYQRHELLFQEHIDQHKPHVLLHRTGKAYLLEERPEAYDFRHSFTKNEKWRFYDKYGFEMKLRADDCVLHLAPYEVPEGFEIIKCY